MKGQRESRAKDGPPRVTREKPGPTRVTREKLGRPTGLEPATSGTTNRRSNQLSYGRHRPPASAAKAGAIREGVAKGQALSAWAQRGNRQAMQFDMVPSGAAATAARLAATPGVRQVPHRSLQQFIIPRFLDADACAALCAMIEQEHVPSTITDDIGDAAFRTSSTCNLDHRNALVADLDARLGTLSGIAPAFGEPLQGQRYEVGQEFKPHTDYFEPTGVDFEEHTQLSGQRTWTMMAYLNDVPAGGGTRFLTTGKIHQPEAGKLLIWCNLTPDGIVNPATLHHGMKVRKGRKYIITKWYRERPWPW